MYTARFARAFASLFVAAALPLLVGCSSSTSDPAPPPTSGEGGVTSTGDSGASSGGQPGDPCTKATDCAPFACGCVPEGRACVNQKCGTKQQACFICGDAG